ncbi:MAG: HNH endonuclease [Bacteroidetes bacterium]|nr:MAG: HNH endonuclease [Bacteroidota bacterium]
MANRWGIPKNVEIFVRARDLQCVYCGVVFSNENADRKTKPSWEHIINDIRLNDVDNIALCCISCNASKGAKPLVDWLQSAYCRNKGITTACVSDVVQAAIINPPRLKH